jgi:hypothetical protein
MYERMHAFCRHALTRTLAIRPARSARSLKSPSLSPSNRSESRMRGGYHCGHPFSTPSLVAFRVFLLAKKSRKRRPVAYGPVSAEAREANPCRMNRFRICVVVESVTGRRVGPPVPAFVHAIHGHAGSAADVMFNCGSCPNDPSPLFPSWHVFRVVPKRICASPALDVVESR